MQSPFLVLLINGKKQFQQQFQADKDHSELLTQDNHLFHRSLQPIEYCKDTFILYSLAIPHHSRHRLQPLNRCYFNPLKVFYADECNVWLTNNPGRQIGQFQTPGITGHVNGRCFTMEKEIKLFETCGIYPINENIFTKDGFLP